MKRNGSLVSRLYFQFSVQNCSHTHCFFTWFMFFCLFCAWFVSKVMNVVFQVHLHTGRRHVAAAEQKFCHPASRTSHQPLCQVQDGYDCHGGCCGCKVRAFSATHMWDICMNPEENTENNTLAPIVQCGETALKEWSIAYWLTSCDIDKLVLKRSSSGCKNG